jgi:CRISPR/Cas system-associated exonuclease Cas4 (RecB family)
VLDSGRKAAFSGIIDRVDKRGRDHFILDYKTGADADVPSDRFDLSKREDWHRTLKSVQLPVYIMLYAHARNIAVERLNPALMLLGQKTVVETPLYEPKSTDAERKNKFGYYKKAIAVLIEEILDPEIDFTPAPDPKGNCPFCPFRTMCGTHWLTRKGY